MDFPLLAATEPRDVEYHSSISQKSGGLAVWAGGMWMPISFSQIMGIDCNRIITREVYVAGDDDLGYNYPIEECHYVTDTYAMFDQNGEVIEQLPEWFGTGFYRRYENDSVFANFDNGSLGVRNKHLLRLGLNYARAKETLPAVE